MTSPLPGGSPPVQRPRYVEGLTGVRALAALWVVAHHLNAIVGPRILHIPFAGAEVDITPLLTCGWVGVDIFFVLSAFLLTRQLMDAYESGSTREATWRFLLHRVLRVYPAYLAQLAILFALSWLAHGAPPPWTSHLPLHLVMLQAVTPASEPAINGVYWTLTVEFWFYLCLPWLVAALHAAEGRGAAALARRAVLLYAAMAATAIAFRAAMIAASGPQSGIPIEWATRQLPATFDIFAAGMVAGVASRTIGRGRVAVPTWSSDALVAGGLAGIVSLLYVMHAHYLSYWAGGPLFYSWHLLAALCAALMVLGVSLDGRLARALFSTRPARYLGEISYSVYLWHLPIALWIATRLPPASGEAAYVAAALLAVLAASAVSCHAIERPVLARRGDIEQWLGRVARPA